MAKTDDRALTSADGSMDWSAGVNSIKTTTIQSDLNKNGLTRNELSWLDNATVRGGAIVQRPGWINNGNFPAVGAFQGASFYSPDNENPYIMAVIDGNLWKIDVDNPGSGVNLSQQFSLYMPITERCYFCQAEQFLVIQAGDLGSPNAPLDPVTNARGTKPLFWDGTNLFRSKGITSKAATPASGPHVNEIPAATVMCYYMGRLWYAQGRNYSAGDIVGGITGTLAYSFKDSVLCVQENPLCVGGDGFTVPTTAGNIRGIAYAANINTQLGEGQLYIGTREQIYALTVPVSRADWIATGNAPSGTATQMPIQTVVQVTNGWVNDTSIVSVNGDLFFQSLEPSIRSLAAAVRNWGNWGNVPISINENRVLQFVDRSLLRFSSGIYFDNRLLQTTLPFVCPVGVAHKAVIPLNFDVISSLWGQLQQIQNTGATNDYPAWEGMWEGIDVLKLLEADFGGQQRAFAISWSDSTQSIQLWEITNFARFDNNENRVVWYAEFPALTWGNEFAMKKLVAGEVWYDSLFGEAIFRLDYRPDGYVCWYPWHEWKCCTAGGPVPTVQYPIPTPRESYRQTQTIPSPPRDCAKVMGRPSYVGYQFQIRLTVKGYCRLRGLVLHAEPVERKLYENMQ